MEVVEVVRWRSYYLNVAEKFLRLCVNNGDIIHLSQTILQEVLVESSPEDVRLDRTKNYLICRNELNSNEQTEIYTEKRDAKVRIRKTNEGLNESKANEFVVFYLE